MGPITRVEISFFKPTGYVDTHFVDTENRGLAAKTVMAMYGAELKCLNYISAELSSLPNGAKCIPPT